MDYATKSRKDYFSKRKFTRINNICAKWGYLIIASTAVGVMTGHVIGYFVYFK